MSYIEQTLITDEKVNSLFSIHWFVYIAPIAFSFILIGIPSLIKLLFTEYGLTNKRVVTKTGMISRNTEEMKLNKVENVEIKQGIIGRIFGFGNVVVTGTGSSKVVISNVSGPLNVKKKIDSLLDS